MFQFYACFRQDIPVAFFLFSLFLMHEKWKNASATQYRKELYLYLDSAVVCKKLVLPAFVFILEILQGKSWKKKNIYMASTVPKTGIFSTKWLFTRYAPFKMY